MKNSPSSRARGSAVLSLSKITAAVTVLGTVGNLILLSIVVSRAISFHSGQAVDTEIHHVRSNVTVPCPDVPCPDVVSAVAEHALDGVPGGTQHGSFGRPHCRFNHETDWDTLPVPVCASHGEARSFLMVFMGESGSSAIQWGTMRHSRIYERDEENGASFSEMELIEDWHHKKVAKIDRIQDYFQMADEAGKIPGFKVRPGHTEALTKTMPQYKPRFIWNYRANTLAKAVGILRKKQLRKPSGGYDGNTTWAEECEKKASCKVKIDVTELLSRVALSLREERRLFETLQELEADCVLPVSYEEFDECPDRVFAQIYKFLGLPYEYHPPKYNKMSADDLCDSIENWDEICDTIMPCRDLRWQLDSHFRCKCNNLDFKQRNNMKCRLEKKTLKTKF